MDPAELADRLPQDQILPYVSIIVPCYNEADTIRLLLEAIHWQTYPLSRLEVIIADGLSTDNTREEIERFRLNHLGLDIRLVDNPQRTIPAGLNRALRAAQGEIIVRLDAHSMPKAEYVQFCVEDLRDCLGDNVGGVWEIMPRGDGAEARAIAYGAAHPLAVGDARYRYASQAQLTDTVPFGAYRRSLIDRVGFYNETLLTNEDYELNARVRQTGGKIYLDPRIRSTYFARPNLTALIQQYWRYGFWKAQMIRLNPRTLRWRQLLPPLFILGIIIGGILGFWQPFAWLLLLLVLLAYGLVLLFIGIQAGLQKKDLRMIPLVPLMVMAMHIAWGAAFLWSLPQAVVSSAYQN
jgi:succinoglycan biosynthesis protein ExoA